MITPASLPSSSTTGSVSTLYLSNSSVTRFSDSITVTLDQRFRASSLSGVEPGAINSRASGTAPVSRSSASTRNSVFNDSSSSSLLRRASIASCTVAVFVQRHILGIHQRAGGVVVDTRCSSLTSDLDSSVISSRISFEVSSSSSASTSAASSGDISSMISAARSGLERFENAGLNIGIHLGQRVGGDLASIVSMIASRSSGTEFFDDIGQIGRMHLFERLVGNVQPQAALRVRLDDVAVLPPDRVRRESAAASGGPRAAAQRPGEPAKNAAHPDVDFQHIQLVIAVRRA